MTAPKLALFQSILLHFHQRDKFCIALWQVLIDKAFLRVDRQQIHLKRIQAVKLPQLVRGGKHGFRVALLPSQFKGL